MLSSPRALACASLLVIAGCFSLDESLPIEPPPSNPRVTASATPLVAGPRVANVTVLCDGPAEEIEGLGPLCGTGELDWKLLRTEDDTTAGWGLALRDLEWDPEAPSRGLMLFVRHPQDASDRVANASYAAFVGIPEPADWEAADVVTRGEIHSEEIGEDACGRIWLGSAELYWRSTVILASWLVALDC
jgi:hypothetical protein